MTIGVGTLLAGLGVILPLVAALVGLAVKLALVLGKHATLLEAQAKREEHIAQIPIIARSVASLEGNFATLATRVHEIHTRVVVLDRTKRSRDELHAVRPGEYRSRPGDE